MLITFEQLLEIRKKHKNIVLAGGCYDLLHVGHIKFLEKCRQYGDTLIVSISSDVRVTERKGKQRPIIKQNDRAYMLSAISIVDYVLISPEPINEKEPPTRLVINALKPDFFTTNDIRFEEYKKELAEQSTKVVYVAPVPANSTSDIICKICDRYN